MQKPEASLSKMWAEQEVVSLPTDTATFRFTTGSSNLLTEEIIGALNFNIVFTCFQNEGFWPPNLHF